MSDRGVTTMQARVARLLRWLEQQRKNHANMVLDADDASLWAKEEADAIKDHINTVEDVWHHCEELDFLRHEGGPQSVASIEKSLRDMLELHIAHHNHPVHAAARRALAQGEQP